VRSGSGWDGDVAVWLSDPRLDGYGGLHLGPPYPVARRRRPPGWLIEARPPQATTELHGRHRARRVAPLARAVGHVLHPVALAARRVVTGPPPVAIDTGWIPVRPVGSYGGVHLGVPVAAVPGARGRTPGWVRESQPSLLATYVHGRRRRVRLRRIRLAPALGAAALAVPWLLPGFSQMVAEAVAPPTTVVRQPAVVDDPNVLPAAYGPYVAQDTTRLHGRLAAAGVPQWIQVPRLQVSSPVVPISMAGGGLVPPSNPSTIGWWEEGSQPGAARGAAVLTGHTVHTGGGAFDHLSALLPGDTVRVRTAAGELRYRVVSVTDYRTHALAAHALELFQRTGPGRLVLVTCSQWTGTEYLANTVVQAVPVA
jgi:LPXTG-site transpeptidase (sortase) family protein